METPELHPPNLRTTVQSRPSAHSLSSITLGLSPSNPAAGSRMSENVTLVLKRLPTQSCQRVEAQTFQRDIQIPSHLAGLSPRLTPHSTPCGLGTANFQTGFVSACARAFAQAVPLGWNAFPHIFTLWISTYVSEPSLNILPLRKLFPHTLYPPQPTSPSPHSE